MDLPKNKYLRELWQLLEYPQSSTGAKVLAVVEIIVIVLAVAAFCIETLPDFHDAIRKGWPNDKTAAVFFSIEASCMIIFTLEFILRVISCPDKIQFCKGVLNIIDLITILPFYVTLSLKDEAALDSFVVLRVVRLARVFRILKLSRHSRGLITLGLALRASLRELALLFFFLLIGIVLFSSGVYYADLTHEDSPFDSILDGFWWAVITMTTVGYGDDVPQSNWGKCFLIHTCSKLKPYAFCSFGDNFYTTKGNITIPHFLDITNCIFSKAYVCETVECLCLF